MLALLPALLQLAPSIAGMLAGKDAAQVVDKVVNVAKQVSNTDDPEQALAVLQASEEKRAEFALRLESLEFEDRKDARARDVAIVKMGRNNTRGDVLAYSAVGALCITIMLLFVFKVPEESRELLLVVLGALVAIVKDVMSFEFGSSKDSQRNAQAVVDVLHGNGKG